jgi:two-component system OmpR family response regulator
MASKRTLIFLVDDDDMYLKTAVHTLSQNRSFDIKQFTSGEAAIEAAKSSKKKPDVMVLDYFLNSENSDAISGLEILKKVKEEKLDAEIIMLSGQENIDVAVNSVKYGAYDYVVKNKSAFIRVQNDIKRIALHKVKEDETRKLRKFISTLLTLVVVICGIAATLFLDPTFFGLIPDDSAPREEIVTPADSTIGSSDTTNTTADH